MVSSPANDGRNVWPTGARALIDHQPARLTSTALDWSTTAMRVIGGDASVSVVAVCSGDSGAADSRIATCVGSGDWFVAADVTTVALSSMAGSRRGSAGEHAANMIEMIIYRNRYRTFSLI